MELTPQMTGKVIIHLLLKQVNESRALRQEVDQLKVAVQRPERIKYTPEEAAQRLKIGRTKLYQLMKKGALLYHTEGDRRYITEAQILTYEHQARLDAAR